MSSGVYVIKNLINSKSYIGCSNNIEKRLSNHKSALKNNNHYNIKLQRAYNKYGKENFIFESLELCDISELFKLEDVWCKKLDSINNGYNISNTNPLNKNRITEEIKIKISNSKKGKPGGNKGTKWSSESRLKMSNSRKGIPLIKRKLIQYDKNMNVLKIWDSESQAKESLGLKTHHINECCSGRRKSASGFIWKYSQ